MQYLWLSQHALSFYYLLRLPSSLSNTFRKTFARASNRASTIINNNALLSIKRSKKRSNNNNNKDSLQTRLTTKNRITLVRICYNNKKLYTLHIQKRTKF